LSPERGGKRGGEKRDEVRGKNAFRPSSFKVKKRGRGRGKV